MNSSIHQLTNLIIDTSIIVMSSLTICLSFGIFCFILYHLIKRKHSANRVALLLIGNMYLTLLIFCILLLEQYTRVIQGHLYLLISLNDGIYCQFRAYFVLVSICTIFYSNTLQAIYRLCRVVFHTRQSLQSFRLYQILILIQWIICFLMIIPTFVLGDFKYLVDDYHCQIEYQSMRSTLLNGTLAYMIPMNTTIGCYMYTVRKMRQGNNSLIHTMTHIQQVTARRDLIVLFRICILLGLLMAFFIPSTIILSIYNFTGYLPWWSSQIQWLVFITSIMCVTIVLAFISPHIRHLWTIKLFHQRARNTANIVL
ncbi:unnamed protein product [Adineta steineri]|uniref:G-protein coupled receptors family 1 profile domain-containing protein n=1 Tax=Adineta steineri TaxID=433720 RepID=A0A814EB29_9BILA|nr:unnamed protein product [Adineta steineri]CAF1404885.1 unnamed protein product [Adineta steineri]